MSEGLFELPRTTKAADFFGRILPGAALQLPQASVPHALVYQVDGAGGGTWSVRLTNGRLEVAAETPWPIASVTVLTAGHFRELVAGAVRDQLVQVLRKLGKPLQVPDLRNLPTDPARVAALAGLQGSLAVVLNDREVDDSYRIFVSFGATPTQPDKPTCTVEVDLADAAALLAARTPPLQWFASGKFRVKGDTSLPVRALGALLSA